MSDTQASVIAAGQCRDYSPRVFSTTDVAAHADALQLTVAEQVSTNLVNVQLCNMLSCVHLPCWQTQEATSHNTARSQARKGCYDLAYPTL